MDSGFQPRFLPASPQRHGISNRRVAFFWLVAALLVAVTTQVSGCWAQTLPGAGASPQAVVIEAEDFKPVETGNDGWHTVFNGQGNYMVDTIGFDHISGERLLSAPAGAKNARAQATITVPTAGDYRLWARFEQPVGAENRFSVTVRQGGATVGSAVLGEASAPKYFFGQLPVPEAGAPWGWEGLVEQSFDLQGLQAGPAQVELTAVAQPLPCADRNVDFLYLTPDLDDAWRHAKGNDPFYPLLDAALAALPTRYYLRLTSPVSQTLTVREKWNRRPWNVSEVSYPLIANQPGNWVPLRHQDVCHFSTLVIQSATSGLTVHAELASDPEGHHILRAFDWNDPQSNQLLLSLPPYPGKYPGESVQTVEEQYLSVARYLQEHPPVGGRDPLLPLNWATSIPVWERGRVGDAAAAVYHAVGMRGFLNFARTSGPELPAMTKVARERFAAWHLPLPRSVALGAYRQPPTPENIARVKAAAQSNGLLPNLQRFDYGDEIRFSEWLKPFTNEDLQQRFAAWQQQHKGKVEFTTPDSSGLAADNNPVLYVDSLRFYEDTAIQSVASQARAIPEALGPDVLYGANYLAHPYYYPQIASYIKWFRATPSGDYAANFGRHSDYFWQVHQPGPMIDGYIAEHFRAGMRDNPKALLLQYTMPHSPGNTDASFLRTAFTHLAHGARGLDFFGIGVNSSDTENYIDFRDPGRYAAIRQVNRSMATIEDILPASHVVPSKVALILSDSTERWDLAPITADRAGTTIEGIGGIFANNPKVRLTYHQDRVGMYYALVNAGHPPDLMTEDDVQGGRLKDYQLAYWVGDCCPPAVVAALSAWVQQGGKLVATAGALRYDEYHQPAASGLALLGIGHSALTEATRFVRPLIELPRLTPLDDADGMPALAVMDAVTPTPEAKVTARFKSGSPAVLQRVYGQGAVTYIATLPGLAYLWSAYQPPPVVSHGPGSHVIPVNFNATAERLITAPALTIPTSVDTHGAHLDARLLAAPRGYAIPLANYSADITRPVTLTIRGVPPKSSVSSALCGRLKTTVAPDGAITVQYAPGIGDILRIDPPVNTP